MLQERNFLVGTRDSILARCQTELVLKKILSYFPGFKFEIVACKTSADKILDRPIAQLGGSGVFVKELQIALLEKRLDFVVHSLKDLPVETSENLCLSATIERMDPRDVLVSRNGAKWQDLPSGARIATSSRRRAAQLSAERADLEFVDIRGNIQTRLRKLEEGQCDAMILAAAGLLRLGLDDRIAHYFDADQCTPAAGQGALGIECRKDDQTVLAIMQQINDSNVWACTKCERAFLHKLGGGCSIPVGALAQMTSPTELELKACVAALDGSLIIKGSACGSINDAEKAGANLAGELIKQGAGAIVDSLLNGRAGNVSPP